MDVRERLMSDYDNLSFHFLPNMPKKIDGLISNQDVYIKKDLSAFKQTEVLAEELGHYLTTAGNITDYSELESRQQETKARQVGYFMVIGLDDLIDCYHNGITSVEELSEHFEVSDKFIYDALEAYRVKNGMRFVHNGYHFDLRNGIRIY